MNVIKRQRLPGSVYRIAHMEYPNAAAQAGLYMSAFFGHAHLQTSRTPESVWRGLLRSILKSFTVVATGTQKARQQAARQLAGCQTGRAEPETLPLP